MRLVELCWSDVVSPAFLLTPGLRGRPLPLAMVPSGSRFGDRSLLVESGSLVQFSEIPIVKSPEMVLG